MDASDERNDRSMKRQKLHEPHILPLTQLVEKWKSETGLEIPYFDPDDGGVDAQLLLLFEKPGPSIFANNGSGFVSQDNKDGTAEAIKYFLHAEGIPRSKILIWNAVVAWNGTRRIGPFERVSAPQHLTELLDALPRLKGIVQVGKEAEKILGKVTMTARLSGYSITSSLHPSPINKNLRHSKWCEIPKIWANAARLAKISWPSVMNDVIEFLSRKLDEEQQMKIRTLSESDLIQSHRTLGQWIRNELNLFNGNAELLKATGSRHPDDASAVIVEALWHHLQSR